MDAPSGETYPRSRTGPCLLVGHEQVSILKHFDAWAIASHHKLMRCVGKRILVALQVGGGIFNLLSLDFADTMYIAMVQQALLQTAHGYQGDECVSQHLADVVCLNSRHPGPECVWKVGSEACLLPPRPRDLVDPQDLLRVPNSCFT